MIKFVIPFILLLWSLNGVAENVGPWIEVKNQDGLKVSKRVHKNSDLLEFRGEGVIEAELATVIALLTDPYRITEWVENCLKADLVKANYDINDRDLLQKKLSEFYHIQYLEMFVPWPFQNRDVVIKGSVNYYKDKETGLEGARLLSHRVDWQQKPPIDGLTRMPIMTSSLDVRQVGGSHTFIDFRVRADPGGRIPEWIVNFVTGMLPLKTMENIREMVKKGEIDKKRLRLVQHHIDKIKGDQPPQASGH